jgi:predicted ABC-type ATPase
LSFSPYFFLLAGPNGAGKSSLYRALAAQSLVDPNAEFVNADLYEAEHLQHMPDPAVRSNAAREWADARREALLASGTSFVSETVFSHPSKIALIQSARARGFIVVLIIVGLDDVETLVARVARRVQHGGHNVPRERILARYPRTLENLRSAVKLADVAFLYDSTTPHRLVATCENGLCVQQVEMLPTWAKTVLDFG